MNERIWGIKQKHLANLFLQLEAAYGQMSRSLSDVDKLKHQETIYNLEQEIEVKDRELKEYEARTSPMVQHRMHTHWDDHLPHIDFRTANQWFERVLNEFSEEGGAAAFLLQNSNTMGGHWLIKRMRASLSTQIDFKPFPVVFESYEHLNHVDFLKKLGESLGIRIQDDDLNMYSLHIIERICQSLQSGSVVFIEIELWQNLAQREDFISWFLQDFWKKLLYSWHMASRQLPFIKLIAVIIANTPVPANCFPHLRCTCDQFRSEKLLELPLDRWIEQDIRTWLYTHSKLTSPAYGLSRVQIDAMARNIYETSDNGLPSSVHRALLRALENVTWKAQA